MPIKLQILHASDFEGGIPAIDDAVRFSALLNYFTSSNTGPYATPTEALPYTLTLSSGDNYIPGAFFNASSDLSLNNVGGLTSSSGPIVGRADIGILNALGVQASVFGNHEFDLGTSQVSSLLNRGSGNPGTKFPYLSTNLDFAPDANLRSLVAANPISAEASDIPGKIAKSTIITLANNEKVGIVGATTPTLRSISSPGDVGVLPLSPTDYDALAAEIQKTVDALTSQGINKIILLAHMQQFTIERDELAPRLKDVDIIIAGGSHTPLLDANDAARTDGGNSPQSGYPVLKTSSVTGQPVLVLNTDANYRYVGRLVVEFDDQGVVNVNSLNDTLNGAFATDEAGVDRVYGTDVIPSEKANPNVVAITSTIRAVISGKDNTIFGKTDVFLNGTRTDVRTQETNFGNLTADANLDYARSIDTTTVISLKNGGGIRDNIGTVSASAGALNSGDVQKLPPQPNPLAPNKTTGDISQLDIENSLRFNNGLTLVTVTASQLVEILEHGVAETAPGRTPGRFPQVGGLSFSFDPTKPATEDLNGNGGLDSGEDRNSNGVLDPGQRIRSLAITNEDGQITEFVVQDGAIVGDANRTFRMVTLNFLADGGDSYPFERFIEANPTLANRVDLVQKDVKDGTATFADTGSEQDALAEYLAKLPQSFSGEDTNLDLDQRIQNLSARSDGLPTGDRQFSGTSRRDVLLGNAGDDILLGLGGNDVLRGFDGDDLLEGRLGADRLDGGKGQDTLSGGGGRDRLNGGNGGDLILAGKGNDRAIGGDGRDIFGLERGAGQVTIRDFKNRQDRLGLGNRIEFADLEIRQTGSSVQIRLESDLLATLLRTEVTTITRADFTTV